MNVQDAALVEIGRRLRGSGYHFVAPTPSTCRIVNARASNGTARSLTDIFGWSRPFDAADVPAPILRLLETADAVESERGRLKSTVRFSKLDDLLLVHSAFPTDRPDSVFLGPDTYRFARLLRSAVAPHGRAVDIGSGSGAGGLVLRRLGDVDLVMTDLNEKALRYCGINAALNGCPDARIVASDVFDNVPGFFDLIVSNPPYLSDGPLYRDGGTMGIEVARRIASQALERLTPDGRLILYTGTPIVAGTDVFFDCIAPLLGCRAFTYEEIDPDVFGEELEKPGYEQVERIAVVALVVTNGACHA